jgi:uncharacterized protein (TIGR00288 family)
MAFQDNNEDAVVFFDFENIVYSLRNRLGENPNFEVLMDKCQEYGRIILARAYADWSRHNTVIAPLQASGFDPVYVPTYFYESKEQKARKNAVDIHIAIEAVEVMYTQPHINTFVLITGDKDFIPLANALRRHGKTVVAIGVQGTTSPYMEQATDEFAFYHQLFPEDRDKKRKPREKDIYKVLVDVVEKLQREGQKTVFPQVKHTMIEILGSFDEKKHKDSKGNNFNRFKDFILEAQRLGYVQLVTTGSVNEVLLPGDIAPIAPIEEYEIVEEVEVVEPVKEEAPVPVVDSSPVTQVTDTESAFELLVWAVNHASQQGKSLRTSSIKTIMRGASSNFDEKQLKNSKGENFAKFSDFIRAATRRGLVRIEGKGIRMEVHPNGSKTPSAESKSKPESEPVSEEPEPSPDVETRPPKSQSPPKVNAPVAETPAVETAPASQDETAAAQGAAVELALPEPLAEQHTPQEPPAEQVAPTQASSPYISDYRMRVLVVDALRSCQYPAPAHVIGKHCLEVSEKRDVPLSNRRLNQLLTSARNMGLLKEVDEDGQEFVFVESTTRIKLFLEDDS